MTSVVMLLLPLMQQDQLHKCKIVSGNSMYIYLVVDIGNKPRKLLLDTGSPYSAIDGERIKEMNIKWNNKNEFRFGVMTTRPRASFINMIIGAVSSNVLFIEESMKETNKKIAEFIPIEFDGMLGLDFMRAHNVSIDIGKMEMTFSLRDKPKSP